MTRRVLITADTIKVSKPSIDVLAAAPGDLLFNSDASQLKLLMRGRFNLPGWGFSGSHSGQMETPYPGGLVLPVPPVAIVGDSVDAAGYDIASPPSLTQRTRCFCNAVYAISGTYSSSTNFGDRDSAGYFLSVEAFIDRVRLLWDFDSGISLQSTSFYYAIFENAA